LVATGKELRGDETKRSTIQVSVEEARRSVNETESSGYLECSTVTKDGVEQLFVEAGRVSIEGRLKGRDSFLSSFTKGITGLFDKPKGDTKTPRGDLPPLEKKTSFSSSSLRSPLNAFLSSASASAASTSASTSTSSSSSSAPKPLPKGIPVDKMTGDQVLAWLSAPDFEFAQPYISAFKSHGVNGGILVELSQEDMEQELGITSRLIRKRLLQEIDNLKKNGFSPPFPTSSSSFPTSPSSLPTSTSTVTKPPQGGAGTLEADP